MDGAVAAEGWPVNDKRVYRLYKQENLIVRTKQQKKLARPELLLQPMATVAKSTCYTMRQLPDGKSVQVSRMLPSA